MTTTVSADHMEIRMTEIHPWSDSELRVTHWHNAAGEKYLRFAIFNDLDGEDSSGEVDIAFVDLPALHHVIDAAIGQLTREDLAAALSDKEL